MLVYLAYKFTNVKDKEDLINSLNDISKTLNFLGHQTFILGRDIQNWKKSHISQLISLFHIIKNMIKANKIFAFINSDEKSTGLSTELKIAKILGKNVTILKKNTVTQNYFEDLRFKTTEFVNIDDLKERLKSGF